jgi:hypothetical protein
VECRKVCINLFTEEREPLSGTRSPHSNGGTHLIFFTSFPDAFAFLSSSFLLLHLSHHTVAGLHHRPRPAAPRRLAATLASRPHRASPRFLTPPIADPRRRHRPPGVLPHTASGAIVAVLAAPRAATSAGPTAAPGHLSKVAGHRAPPPTTPNP